MLNRIIYSNEGKLKNNIEQTAVKVLETYTYGEIFIPSSKDTVSAVINAAKNNITDEIFPLRLYNINNYGIMFANIGEDSIKAYAEVILLCVNIALAIDLSDFKVKVSAKKDIYGELKSTISAYEIDGYVSFEESENFEISGTYNDKAFLKGGKCENSIFADFDMDILLEILYTDKIKNAVNLPLVLVGSDNAEALHKTAFGLRAKGLTVETYVKKGTMYDAEEYAEIKNITILMWITDEGRIIMKNIKNGEMSETTLEKVLSATD